MPLEFTLETIFDAIKDFVEGNESKLSDEDKMVVQQKLELNITEATNKVVVESWRRKTKICS